MKQIFLDFKKGKNPQSYIFLFIIVIFKICFNRKYSPLVSAREASARLNASVLNADTHSPQQAIDPT